MIRRGWVVAVLLAATGASAQRVETPELDAARDDVIAKIIR
jgi:hypothetical protein